MLVYVIKQKDGDVMTFDEYLKHRAKADADIAAECSTIPHIQSLIHDIVELRKKSGLTIDALANEVDIDVLELMQFETGEYDPTLSFVQRILQRLNCTLIVSVNDN